MKEKEQTDSDQKSHLQITNKKYEPFFEQSIDLDFAITYAHRVMENLYAGQTHHKSDQKSRLRNTTYKFQRYLSHYKQGDRAAFNNYVKNNSSHLRALNRQRHQSRIILSCLASLTIVAALIGMFNFILLKKATFLEKNQIAQLSQEINACVSTNPF